MVLFTQVRARTAIAPVSVKKPNIGDRVTNHANLTWTAGLPVKISCSMDWMMLEVTPQTYSSHRYMFADELHLGSGCPVTRIQTYAYDFIYPVYDCGIRTQVVSEHTLIFRSELYYNPRDRHHHGHTVPLECSAIRKSVWLTPVSTDEIQLDPSPFLAAFETTPEELGLLSSD
ncbi:oocyte-secreted protein 2-like isoform X1 [Saccopteryx leptura]|uniref:oocyte-secreted protein 2-like isoform X1 n=2 Tax=Saccopteryx leptura TaxID=249018 RepID=UPI00339CB58F